jgi:hypothetical protein
MIKTDKHIDTGLRVREDGSYYVDFEVFLKRPEVLKHYKKKDKKSAPKMDAKTIHPQ